VAELKIFVGWDDAEKSAYEVLKYSIEKNTHSDVKVIPLYHKELRRQGFFHRPWETEARTGNRRDFIDGKNFSTEFSHSRFLVPELMKFKGWALFMDCDMLMRCDVKEIFELCDERFAVMCVKHRQEVKKSVKMDGSPQQPYYRKNWSSFVLWNCGHEANKQITKELVNSTTGGWLHSFAWLEDHQIGTLPDYYNWIEGTSRSIEYPRVIHYSEGGPWHDGYQDVMYADQWEENYSALLEMRPEPNAQLTKIDYANV
jgi:lipopolysaccharide biosynthesis glycosyltransferase